MIDKKQAQKQGLTTLDGSARLSEEKATRLDALKALAPELINGDGNVNVDALHDFIGMANTTSNNKGYELTFAGKGIARAKADSDTDKELKFEPAQSKNAVIHNNNNAVGTHPENDTKNIVTHDNNTVGTNPRVCPDTENIVIRGDNLDALKTLKQNYFEKIKMIYIDPPYNTKSENFIYNDNFKQTEADLIEKFDLQQDTTDFLHNVYGTRSHSGWLSFMYPRLKLARDLLKQDGVIFISIDDNEQANLKIICDEIFGEDNFVDCIVWQRKRGRDNSAKWFSKSHEYLLVYAKNKNNLSIKTLEINEETKQAYKNPDNDARGAYRMLAVWSRGTQGGVKYSFTNKNGQEFKERLWLYSKENLTSMDKEDKLIVRGNNLYRKMFLNEHKGRIAETIWNDVSNTANASDEIKALFGEIVFDTSKPIPFLQQILKLTTNKNDIILDFFAGSGTTGDAVMQLNSEDGGNRKFILVQWDEVIPENSEAHRFCKDNGFAPVISSITLERLNRAGDNLLKQSEGKLDFGDKLLDTAATRSMTGRLDIGYKVFSLTEKPKLVEKQEESQQEIFVLENERKETIDTLYNMLTATCKPLHTKICELIKGKLYECDGALYVLAEITQDDLAAYPDHVINIDGWSDISLESWLNLFGINDKDKERINVVY